MVLERVRRRAGGARRSRAGQPRNSYLRPRNFKLRACVLFSRQVHLRHPLPLGCCRDGPCIAGSKVHDNKKVDPAIGHTALSSDES